MFVPADLESNGGTKRSILVSHSCAVGPSVMASSLLFGAYVCRQFHNYETHVVRTRELLYISMRENLNFTDKNRPG